MTEHEVWRPYEVPEGRVWVVVRPALVSSYWAEELGWLDGFRCLVELTTDPPGNTGIPGFLVIGRRRYRIRTSHERLNHDREWLQGDGTRRRWCSGPVPTQGGFRTDSGQLLGWGAPIIDRLTAIEAAVLDRFEEDHPQWQRDSERLGLLTDKVTADAHAERLHRLFAEADAKADAIHARLTTYQQ